MLDIVFTSSPDSLEKGQIGFYVPRDTELSNQEQELLQKLVFECIEASMDYNPSDILSTYPELTKRLIVTAAKADELHKSMCHIRPFFKGAYRVILANLAGIKTDIHVCYALAILMRGIFKCIVSEESGYKRLHMIENLLSSYKARHPTTEIEYRVSFVENINNSILDVQSFRGAGSTVFRVVPDSGVIESDSFNVLDGNTHPRSSISLNPILIELNFKRFNSVYIQLSSKLLVGLDCILADSESSVLFNTFKL